MCGGTCFGENGNERGSSSTNLQTEASTEKEERERKGPRPGGRVLRGTLPSRDRQLGPVTAERARPLQASLGWAGLLFPTGHRGGVC